MLHVVGHRGLDFVARQVRGQLLVPRLTRHVPAALVGGDDDLRLFHRRGQARRRIGRLRRVAEVELQLIRVFQVPLAAMAEGPLQQFVDRELLLLDRAVLLRDLLALLGDRSGLLDDQTMFGKRPTRREAAWRGRRG